MDVQKNLEVNVDKRTGTISAFCAVLFIRYDSSSITRCRGLFFEFELSRTESQHTAAASHVEPDCGPMTASMRCRVDRPWRLAAPQKDQRAGDTRSIE